MADDSRSAERQPIQAPPFSVRLLQQEDESNADATPPDDNSLLSLLPASYYTASYRPESDLAAASRNVVACIREELDLHRLSDVFDLLWVAGRPMPPRPLHHQLLLSRDIFVTEQMDMHLVWTKGRMFLKPIPRFLLEPRFWTAYLSCTHGCRCAKQDDSLASAQKCDQRLWKCALGFLFSYAALIAHESDFYIATDSHLLPAEVTWPLWRILVEQINTEHIYPKIDARFTYGELRLSRLNKIYRLSQHSFMRGYMSHWNQYGSFYQDNFTWLASVIVYIAIVLTAMQVGLATKTLVNNDAFSQHHMASPPSPFWAPSSPRRLSSWRPATYLSITGLQR